MMPVEKITTNEIINHIAKDVNGLKVSYKQKPKPNLDNWKEVLQSMQISFTASYKEPPVCIEIIQKDNSACHVGSLGNFSVLIGKAKSRKTFLISLFLAAFLKNNILGILKVFLPKGKDKIILFDTEQSQYDASMVVKRILTLSAISNPDNFSVYSLRTLPPDDRLFIIEQKIYDTPDLGMVVIDGVRDLIRDINSPEEATTITSKLLKWTEERDIHIVTVLHQNKGDSNARGHVGSELVNKAESVIAVEKDNEMSVVKSEYFRGRDFEPFAFQIDDKGLPYILEDWSSKTKKKLLTPREIPNETHMKYLKEIFSSGLPKKYKELKEDLKVKFQSFDIQLIHAQLVDFIAYYRINNMVQDTGGKGRTGNQYTLNKSIG